MNDTWNFLKEFESKDIVKRFIKKEYNYNLNSAKAYEITSAFVQGREYFSSSKKADISVRPLLQYYGVVALSRGLILILNKDAREDNIKSSHGLKICNWLDIKKSGKIENLILKSSNGTFNELIKITDNKSYFRVNSSGIGWFVKFDVPPLEIQFSFKEIAFCFPDLKKSVESWLDQRVPSITLVNFTFDDNGYEMEVQGKYNKDLFDLIFPTSCFIDIEFWDKNSNCVVKYNKGMFPNLCQRWDVGIGNIGEPCVVRPLEGNMYINDISTMFAASYIFGMISRYYPSTWNNINKGISNDSVLPFALNFMDFIQEKFPQIVIDFIKSPYNFENVGE